MKLVDVVLCLTQYNAVNNCHVFSKDDLRTLFSQDNAPAFEQTIKRAVRSGILLRATRGVFVFQLVQASDLYTLELIAKKMHDKAVNYISFESALFLRGWTHLPMNGRLIVMTTGRRGLHVTPFGTIDFRHTNCHIKPMRRNVDHALPIATEEQALADLKRTGAILPRKNKEQN